MLEFQKLYLEMLRIRKIEEAIACEYREQQMRVPVHLSIGQEAVAVGLCSLLKKEDQIVSTHRGHAHYLAKGGSLSGLICELYGKAAGCSGGQGGSMHLIDRECGFMGSTSIVGGTIPLGVGLAFAKKLKKEQGIVAICIGDAAVETGVFHESANFAALHQLPVVFVCENNFYSCYTNIKHRQPMRPLLNVAYAHGLKPSSGPGYDVLDVIEKLEEPVDLCRDHGPFFVELQTFRFVEHCGPNNDDHLGYRSEEELRFWNERDPIRIAKSRLAMMNMVVPYSEEIEQEITDAFWFAKHSPPPSTSVLGKYQYADY